MKPAAAYAAGGGTVALGVLAIRASDVSEWLTIIERIVASPAGLLVFCLLVLAGVVYVLARQWHSGTLCDEKVRQLENVVQSMYALLATDDRYQNLPSFEDFAAGKFSLQQIHKARTAPAFNRDRS